MKLKIAMHHIGSRRSHADTKIMLYTKFVGNWTISFLVLTLKMGGTPPIVKF